MNFVIFIIVGIILSYLVIAIGYKQNSWFRFFFIIMSLLAFFIGTQAINNVYDDSVSGNENITCNLTVGCNIIVPNLTVENIHGGSPFNVWADYDMHWNTINNTNLKNTIINNGTFQNFTGFPIPDYDSGWAAIAQNQLLEFTHNVGGDPDCYLVDVDINGSSVGISKFGIGSRVVGGNYQGYYWRNVSSTIIQVYRPLEDGVVNNVRVRIWNIVQNDCSGSGGTSVVAKDQDPFFGTETFEDDLRFPSIYMKAIGVNLPDFSTFLNSTYVWLFDEKKNEELFILGQTPHRRKNSTDMDAHFHWSPLTATSGDVVWCIEFTWANEETTFINSTTQCILDPADGVQYKHQRSPMIVMDGSDKNLSSVLSSRLYRDADNASDTYGFDAALLEFDFHYEVNSFGSDEP